jgi:hypothetical protein
LNHFSAQYCILLSIRTFVGAISLQTHAQNLCHM